MDVKGWGSTQNQRGLQDWKMLILKIFWMRRDSLEHRSIKDIYIYIFLSFVCFIYFFSGTIQYLTMSV